MNRLWVRMSMMFGSVVFISGVLPAIIFAVLVYFGQIEINLPPNFSGEQVDFLTERVQRMIIRDVSRVLFFTIITGLIAGVVASRVLARPLHILEKGAHEIGAKNLDYRVEIEAGSDEIMAVAQSFNQMAHQLERSEKQRQNLLADVAHELRTPLTVIQGNLRGILDDVFPLDKEEIGRLFEQTRHLTRLVDDLHELAQAEAQALVLDKSEIDTPRFLQDVAAGFRPMAEEKEIELRVELLGKLPDLMADKDRLQQSINNLLSNALRYTPAGGSVTLQSEVIDETWLDIRVIDTGVGIAAEHLPNVFERFYRTDPSRKRHLDQGGTGLGLAIVRAISENHGGSVTVHSAGLGQGTTFVIKLPL